MFFPFEIKNDTVARNAPPQILTLILSKCFSQKCWTVSLIGNGSNTDILLLAAEAAIPLPSLTPADDAELRFLRLKIGLLHELGLVDLTTSPP